MKKPDYHWETSLHRAHRIRGDKPSFANDGRSECFNLIFADGHKGRADLGLTKQVVDRASLQDPELEYAIRAWLIARGQRCMALFDTTGQLHWEGAISVSDLDLGALNDTRRPRLISLAPSNLELLEALGALDDVIACEDSSDWPADRPACERLGPDLGPDIERIVALRPAMVLASLTVPGMERIVMDLRRHALVVRVLAPRTLDEIEENIEQVGESLGRMDESQRVLDRFRGERQELMQKREHLLRPVRVYLEWWPRPIYAPGRDCYSNELIELAGGKNIFGDRLGSSLEFQPEEVAAQNPEIAFVSWCGVREDKLDPKRMSQHPELAALDVVREGRVFALDEAYSGRPGPRAMEAARRMGTEIERYARSAGLWRGP